MEKWRENYNRYMNKNLAKTTKGLDEPSCVHYCPNCGNYLWADKNHISYRHCIYCGRNLKGKILPYERI